jgi:hypothetical protein
MPVKEGRGGKEEISRLSGARSHRNRCLRSFKKRVAPKKVSISGLDVCIEGIDLSKLLKGKPLTVASQIAANRYVISISYLTDTGANRPIFISQNLAIKAAKFFSLNTHRLITSCGIKGFNGEPRSPITHAIVMPQFWTGGRRFRNVPMLIADLGQH